MHKKQIYRTLWMTCAAVILFTGMFPGVSSAANAQFIKQIESRYKSIEQAENKLYKDAYAEITKDYQQLLQAVSGQQKTLEKLVTEDQEALVKLLEDDYESLRAKLGNDSKLQSYRNMINPNYSTGVMWKYTMESNKNYHNSAHWIFNKEINPNFSSSYMWVYSNEINPNFSKSTMWNYHNTVNPNYSSSTMWKLHNESNVNYATSTMWNYKLGKISQEAAKRRMDNILSDGQASLTKTRTKAIETLDQLRTKTIAQLDRTRDSSVKTILDARSNAITSILDYREKSFGSRLEIKPLTINIPSLHTEMGIKVIIDGEIMSFEQPAVNRNGSILVPMRPIFEELGAELKWNAADRSVDAVRGSRVIWLKLDSKDALVNQKKITLPVPPQLVKSNTMVPLRFVSEALGAEVKWEAATQSVLITTK